MSGQSWIKFYPSDWITGTFVLTPVERGVYITLLALMYDRQGPIENNTKALARQCGATVKQFSSALASLVDAGKLTIEDDEIFNEKVAKILEGSFRRVERARKGGRAKADKERQQNQQTDSAQADHKQDVSNSEAVLDECLASAIPDTRYQKEKASKLAKKKLEEKQPEVSAPETGLEADLRHAAAWFHDAPRLSHVKPIADLIAEGLSLHDDVIPTIRQLAPAVEHRTSWTYFVGPLEDILRRRKGEAADLSAKPATAGTTSRGGVWVWTGTPQWEAWSKGRSRPWPTSEQRHPDGGRRAGWYFPAEWPPGYGGSDPPPESPSRVTPAPARAIETA